MKSMMWKCVVVWGILMISQAAFAQEENLIRNGGFENAELAPWWGLGGTGVELSDDDGGTRDSQLTSVLSGTGTPHSTNLWGTAQLVE